MERNEFKKTKDNRYALTEIAKRNKYNLLVLSIIEQIAYQIADEDGVSKTLNIQLILNELTLKAAHTNHKKLEGNTLTNNNNHITVFGQSNCFNTINYFTRFKIIVYARFSTYIYT